MNIGYACICLGQNGIDFKTCRIKNADENNLKNLISHNLDILDLILTYNIQNGIKLFRISSEIIPFGSHPINSLDWHLIFQDKFNALGEKIKTNGIRVSMHPAQFTVINSPTDDIVNRAFADLKYHSKILDILGTDCKSKLILHIGGVYGDKKQAIQRFIDNFYQLPDNIKNRLVIENDEKLYNINDLLEISAKINVPVVFDVLHNKINPFNTDKTDNYYLKLCKNSWKEKDGTQKIHYSQQEQSKRAGTHSQTIQTDTFEQFYNSLENKNIDIMLEVKDKNLSVVKCMKIIKNKG